ncbi:MAG: thioredoxin [bacterium]|nr:thioredoxin [bacterium]
MANEGVIVLTDANFQEEVIKSSLPVFVDFWAVWCGPCKMMAAVVDELAKEYAGQIKICQLNVDENPATAGQYKIMSIPSFLFFKDGKVKDQLIGAVPKQKLKAKVAEFLV